MIQLPFCELHGIGSAEMTPRAIVYLEVRKKNHSAKFSAE